ncbi:uncharacterized protein RHIMIDRAFT_288652 [Rhizopus microsporus ATCC 52813]|uniref:Uncharacterized protein n=1 Tax=Rhizopus microsporus ATCC 52813 TaxID=1340429 RepID=A0A2G4TA13_RHIZD|nr:uncharacterized protein RHIMIDRAFT_288652 [Rhizopus microsporus ATCC 52813]PHZ17849.1 hypothetical protein RHIMIDRAFT_288652 [Rhizopus microsporus ATCC 52813]
MESTWDAKSWLTTNYKKNNGLPEFFLEGNYPASTHEVAKETYKATVKSLFDTTEDGKLKYWAQMMILSNFLALELTKTNTFWRRQLIIDEKNLAAKFIKEPSANSMHLYEQSLARQQRFLIRGMHNAFDITGTKQGSHVNHATDELKQIVCNKEFGNFEYEKINAVDEKYITLNNQKNYVNLNRSLHAQLEKAIDQEYSNTKIINHIIETHVHNSIALQADLAPLMSCLLHTDDVVLIVDQHKIIEFLRKCEAHSMTLDVIDYRLYGKAIPRRATFAYLGALFKPSGHISTIGLITANTTKALTTFAQLTAIGVSLRGFGHLLSIRFYTQIIRAQLDYSLTISSFNLRNYSQLEDAQNKCIRFLFGVINNLL